MKLRHLVLILVAILAAILAAYWLRGQVRIDRCLDGGGRWNYELSTCEYADTRRSHGPVMASVNPSSWMFMNSVEPSGENVAPASSESLRRCDRTGKARLPASHRRDQVAVMIGWLRAAFEEA